MPAAVGFGRVGEDCRVVRALRGVGSQRGCFRAGGGFARSTGGPGRICSGSGFRVPVGELPGVEPAVCFAGQHILGWLGSGWRRLRGPVRVPGGLQNFIILPPSILSEGFRVHTLSPISPERDFPFLSIFLYH